MIINTPVTKLIIDTAIIAIISFVNPADGISLSVIVGSSGCGSSPISGSAPPSPGISGSFIF